MSIEKRREFYNGLMALNCANCYEVEEKTKLCFSSECSMNVDTQISIDISAYGCKVYKWDAVQEVVNRSPHLAEKKISL